MYAVIEDSDGLFSINLMASKANVLIDATEPASFATKAEGDFCHVLHLVLNLFL